MRLLTYFFRLTTATLIVATLLIMGCATSKTKPLPESLSESDLYHMAKKALDSEKYSIAIKALNTLEARYPFGPFSQQTFLDLIYANYMDDKPEATRATVDRFIRLNPNHQKADYALYMKGLAANTISSGLLAQYLPLDYNKRDPGQIIDSFQDFAELLEKYPNSQYAPDARQRMIALRNRLAASELYAANYYLKRKAYIAAINRCWYILEHLPQTPQTSEALATMYEGYWRLNSDQAAKETLQTLKLNYPNHPSLDKSGNFIGYKVFDDVNPSLLSTLTFGLFDSKKTKQQEKPKKQKKQKTNHKHALNPTSP